MSVLREPPKPPLAGFYAALVLPLALPDHQTNPRFNHAGEAVKGGPTTPNEQAAALAGTAEKKVGSYKTLKGSLSHSDYPSCAYLGYGTQRLEVEHC